MLVMVIVVVMAAVVLVMCSGGYSDSDSDRDGSCCDSCGDTGSNAGLVEMARVVVYGGSTVGGDVVCGSCD